jgi:hypothetical protein
VKIADEAESVDQIQKSPDEIRREPRDLIIFQLVGSRKTTSVTTPSWWMTSSTHSSASSTSTSRFVMDLTARRSIWASPSHIRSWGRSASSPGACRRLPTVAPHRWVRCAQVVAGGGHRPRYAGCAPGSLSRQLARDGEPVECRQHCDLDPVVPSNCVVERAKRHGVDVGVTKSMTASGGRARSVVRAGPGRSSM